MHYISKYFDKFIFYVVEWKINDLDRKISKVWVKKIIFANDFLKIVNLCKKILPCILRALSYENACTRLELIIGNSPVFSRHCKPKLSASHDKQTNRYSSETPNQLRLCNIKSVCRNKKSQYARMNGWVRGSRPPPPVLVKFSTFSPKQICNGAII